MVDIPRSGPPPAGPSAGPGTYVPGGYYAGDPYGGGGAGEFSGFDWHRYLMVLRRRMWPALTVFVVVALAGVLHGFTRVPVFDAKVRLIVDHDRQNVTGLNDPLTQTGVAADYTDVQTQITMLQSRSLAKQTLQAVGALSGPASPPVIGVTAVPAASEPPEAGQVNGFLGALRVAPVPGSRLIDVTYRSADPVQAAKYVNALAQQFVQQNLDSKLSTSKDLTAYLNSRMLEQRRAVGASDKALQEYAASHGIATTKNESSLLSQKLTDMAGAYTKAKTDSITKGATYTQLQSLKRDNGPLEDFGPIAQSPVVQQLKSDLASAQKNQADLAEKLQPKHPLDVAATEAVKAAEARLHAEVLKVADGLERDYQASQDTEAKFAQAVEAQKKESQSNNRSDLELAILQREADSNRTIYDGLVQRLNEFAVTRESQTNNVRIVDTADVPQSPTGDAAGSDIRYGLFGGVVLALLVAFGLERADNRVKTPQQLKEMGLTILGLVPKIDLETSGPLLSAKTPPAFNEAFRGIRMNIRLSIAKDGMRSLVVTSPRAGDGKTAVATNVAVALALSDQRVLLIDADMRRPRVHSVFNLEMQPGLSDLLVGQSKAADTIRRVDVPNLQVLTCGSMPPNPSELLESRRFVEFLERLQKHFDWVIIDAPPILPVTDASIICGHVDGVVFVASAEQTPLPAVRGALEQLHKASAHVLGVVLNLVDTQRRGYYYSEYYNRDYNRYYEKSAV